VWDLTQPVVYEQPTALPKNLSSNPKPGHWTGGAKDKSATFEFDITPDGNISHFVLDANVYGDTCDVTIETIPVKGSTFDKSVSGTKDNNLFMGIFSGKFTQESMDGSFGITLCGNSVYASNTRDMSAAFQK